MSEITMLPSQHLIKSNLQLTSDVFELVLALPEEETPSFTPGQFSMLYVFGVGEIPISISGDPGVADSLVYTIRSVGTVTNALRCLNSSSVIGVRGPFGQTWPLEQAEGKELLLIAGGIGLAPLRPVLYSVLAHRQEYRRVVLLYGARTPADLLYQHQLSTWEQDSGLELFQTVDIASVQWSGTIGVVTSLIRRAMIQPSESVVMMCGPEIMMRFALLELHRIGLRDEQIYLSLERNMKCAVGFCGRCQYGPTFLCKDGPVFRFDTIRSFYKHQEL